jgi:hypothetical protein
MNVKLSPSHQMHPERVRQSDSFSIAARAYRPIILADDRRHALLGVGGKGWLEV